MPHVEIIAALATNRVIGIDGHMPWHLPADLKHFKDLTVGKTVVMGRRTFESIGKVLPNRRNILVSNTFDKEVPNLEVVSSLEEAFLKVKDGPLVIIGGAGLYREALPFAQVLYLTHIDASFEGDTFFPDFEKNSFVCVESEDFYDENLALNYSSKTWKKQS